MRIVGPQVIVRSHQNAVRAHALHWPARIVRGASPMKPRYAPEKEIVSRIHHVNRGIAGLRQIISARCLVDPADIEPQRLSGEIYPTEHLHRFFCVLFWLCIEPWTSAQQKRQPNRSRKQKQSGRALSSEFVPQKCRWIGMAHQLTPFRMTADRLGTGSN